MKKTEDFISEMENSNILMNREYSFPEYANQLIDFQRVICKLISGEDYYENMRIDEAIFLMESTARKRNLRSNPAVHKGILTMKQFEKEMAITMSGLKGEKLVSKTLEYISRPNTQIFRNVYVTDGQDETELDAIVLTDSGVIILEMKKVKSDLIISEDGRLFRNGDECYDNVPLGMKMAMKRKLLKARIEKMLTEKGLNIPVYVDSLIVFSAPKGQFIRIDDRYHKEKYCFRSNLNSKIENYVGCAYYKEEQLAALGTIFSEMESNVKRFETDLNFDDVRRNLAEALVVLQEEPVETEVSDPVAKVESDDEKSKTVIIDMLAAHDEMEQKRALKKVVGMGLVAANLTGVLLCGVSVLLGSNLRRI